MCPAVPTTTALARTRAAAVIQLRGPRHGPRPPPHAWQGHGPRPSFSCGGPDMAPALPHMLGRDTGPVHHSAAGAQTWPPHSPTFAPRLAWPAFSTLTALAMARATRE